VLIYIALGQLRKGLEVLSIWYSNIVKGGYCNIFIKDGIVIFVIRYYKGYIVSGDVKIIY
jgi:hypothetical protein